MPETTPTVQENIIAQQQAYLANQQQLKQLEQQYMPETGGINPVYEQQYKQKFAEVQQQYTQISSVIEQYNAQARSEYEARLAAPSETKIQPRDTILTQQLAEIKAKNAEAEAELANLDITPESQEDITFAESLLGRGIISAEDFLGYKTTALKNIGDIETAKIEVSKLDVTPEEQTDIAFAEGLKLKGYISEADFVSYKGIAEKNIAAIEFGKAGESELLKLDISPDSPEDIAFAESLLGKGFISQETFSAYKDVGLKNIQSYQDFASQFPNRIKIYTSTYTDRFGATHMRYWSDKAPNGNFAEGSFQITSSKGRVEYTPEAAMEKIYSNSASYLGINRWDIAGQEHTAPEGEIPGISLYNLQQKEAASQAVTAALHARRAELMANYGGIVNVEMLAPIGTITDIGKALLAGVISIDEASKMKMLSSGTEQFVSEADFNRLVSELPPFIGAKGIILTSTPEQRQIEKGIVEGTVSPEQIAIYAKQGIFGEETQQNYLKLEMINNAPMSSEFRAQAIKDLTISGFLEPSVDTYLPSFTPFVTDIKPITEGVAKPIIVEKFGLMVPKEEKSITDVPEVKNIIEKITSLPLIKQTTDYLSFAEKITAEQKEILKETRGIVPSEDGWGELSKSLDIALLNIPSKTEEKLRAGAQEYIVKPGEFYEAKYIEKFGKPTDYTGGFSSGLSDYYSHDPIGAAKETALTFGTVALLSGGASILAAATPQLAAPLILGKSAIQLSGYGMLAAYGGEKVIEVGSILNMPISPEVSEYQKRYELGKLVGETAAETMGFGFAEATPYGFSRLLGGKQKIIEQPTELKSVKIKDPAEAFDIAFRTQKQKELIKLMESERAVPERFGKLSYPVVESKTMPEITRASTREQSLKEAFEGAISVTTPKGLALKDALQGNYESGVKFEIAKPIEPIYRAENIRQIRKEAGISESDYLKFESKLKEPDLFKLEPLKNLREEKILKLMESENLSYKQAEIKINRIQSLREEETSRKYIPNTKEYISDLRTEISRIERGKQGYLDAPILEELKLKLKEAESGYPKERKTYIEDEMVAISRRKLPIDYSRTPDIVKIRSGTFLNLLLKGSKIEDFSLVRPRMSGTEQILRPRERPFWEEVTEIVEPFWKGKSITEMQRELTKTREESISKPIQRFGLESESRGGYTLEGRPIFEKELYTSRGGYHKSLTEEPIIKTRTKGISSKIKTITTTIPKDDTLSEQVKAFGISQSTNLFTTELTNIRELTKDLTSTLTGIKEVVSERTSEIVGTKERTMLATLTKTGLKTDLRIDELTAELTLTPTKERIKEKTTKKQIEETPERPTKKTPKEEKPKPKEKIPFIFVPKKKKGKDEDIVDKILGTEKYKKKIRIAPIFEGANILFESTKTSRKPNKIKPKKAEVKKEEFDLGFKEIKQNKKKNKKPSWL